jgi:hypothetical protein
MGLPKGFRPRRFCFISRTIDSRLSRCSSSAGMFLHPYTIRNDTSYTGSSPIDYYRDSVSAACPACPIRHFRPHTASTERCCTLRHVAQDAWPCAVCRQRWDNLTACYRYTISAQPTDRANFRPNACHSLWRISSMWLLRCRSFQALPIFSPLRVNRIWTSSGPETPIGQSFLNSRSWCFIIVCTLHMYDRYVVPQSVNDF